MQPLCLLLAGVALLFAPFIGADFVYQDPDTITFTEIAAAGAKGQWKLSIAIGSQDAPGVWTPSVCKDPTYGACFNSANPPPFDKPLKVLGPAQVQVTYSFNTSKTTFVTFNSTNQIPQTLEFKMCYSNIAFADRPWRKKNKPYPALSDNCPFSIANVNFPTVSNLNSLSAADQAALSGTAVLNLDNDDSLVTGTYFFMLWVRCSDGNVCAFESTESPNVNSVYSMPYNGNYVETSGYDPITTGLKVAAGILAAVGPIFFIVYYTLDNMHYTRTGKPLAW